MSARVVPRIALGSEGYSVARLLLGGWQLSAGHRADSIDEPSLFARLEAMIDAGFTSFDCADIYTGVEELFGRLRSRVRTPLEIHTKYVPDAGNLEGLRASDVERVIDRSLRRLGVERLDLVQFHWWDYAVPGYVEAAGWLDELRARGKIRHLGLTNFDAERTRELCEAGLPLVAMQAQSSLLDRRVESGMEALAHEFDFQLLCYGTLAGGLLSERFLGRAPEEFEASTRSLTKYRAIVEEAGGWSALQALLEGLRRVAERHAVPLAAVAVRWVLDRPRVAAALIGTFRATHLDSLLSACTLELDAEDEQRLREASRDLRPLPGQPFELERDPEGAHAKLMWRDQQRGAAPAPEGAG